VVGVPGSKTSWLARVVLSMAAAASAPPPAPAATLPGSLRQLDGPAGCLVAEPRQGCAQLRNVLAVADLAVSPDGRHVYVAASQSDTVVVLARAARTGRLVQIQGRGGCVSARPRVGCTTARALRDPSAVAISHDGHNVYVTEDDVGVAVFARDPRTGRLTQLPGPAGCVAPGPRFGCTLARALRGGRATVAPDDRQVYVASASYDTESVVILSRSPGNGALMQLSGFDGCTNRSGLRGCRRGRGLADAATVAYSPDGASVYVPSRSGSVAIFGRRTGDGALAQPADPMGCVSGALPVQFCGRVRAIGGANDTVVSPDGRHVYVAAFTRGVAAFERDLASGWLTQLPGSDGCVSTPASTVCGRARGIVPFFGAGTGGVVLSPDGRTLYASSWTSGDGGIAVLRRDPASGALRELPGGAGCLAAKRRRCTPVRGLDESQTIAVSPDGRQAYALSGYFEDAVAVFAVHPHRRAWQRRP
jgi:DNA-binding beta-propeller fold protein YncE